MESVGVGSDDLQDVAASSSEKSADNILVADARQRARFQLPLAAFGHNAMWTIIPMLRRILDQFGRQPVFHMDVIGIEFPRRVQRQGSVGHKKNVRVLRDVLDELAYVLHPDPISVMEQEAHRDIGV